MAYETTAPQLATFDQAVAVIDRAEADCRRGTTSSTESLRTVAAALRAAFGHPHNTVDELSLLAEYATEMARALAERTCDPALVEYLDRSLSFAARSVELTARLDDLLDEIGTRLAAREPHAQEELAAICERGWNSHRHLLVTVDGPRKVLKLAYRHRDVAALLAAVRVRSERSPCLANPSTLPDLATVALDMLAHLAAEPQGHIGQAARDALLDLSEGLDIAGAAAARLPVHLLSPTQLERLSEVYAARVELFTEDVEVLPVAISQLRDTEIVKGALLLAHDARRLP